MSKKTVSLFILILILGILPRVWNFGYIPAGLHQDEAANGVDAYDVLTYRMDRTGIVLPVQFISWGSGQSALYAYTALPFIRIWGLTQITIRLPNLLAGICMMPLLFLAGRKIMNTKFGLISMFIGAISPWNVMGSRWGLEAYFVPFLFLAGFTCYLYSEKNNYWFVIGSILLSACLYAYSTAFATVPIFMVFSILILWRMKKIGWRGLILGVVVFGVLSLPILLFILVNSFDLEPIRFLKFTIPRLPTDPRYKTTVSIFQSDVLGGMLVNIKTMLTLLWTQKDGLIWNSVEPFGFLYPLAIIPGVLGIVGILREMKYTRNFNFLFIFSWFIGAIFIGILQPATIQRLSLLYLPLTFCIAYFIYMLSYRSDKFYQAAVICYLAGFSLFIHQYFSSAYQSQLSQSVSYDILSAVQFSAQYPEYRVCISDRVHEANIYVLFVEKPMPSSYLKKSGYLDSDTPFEMPGPMNRYRMNPADCASEQKAILILTAGEQSASNYSGEIHKFGDLDVIVSK